MKTISAAPPCRNHSAPCLPPVASLYVLLAAMLMATAPGRAGTLPPIQTVFVILMENEDSTSIIGNPFAPYINNQILPMASLATHYATPPGNHPSLPNYLWLEAGTNFGIWNDYDPVWNHQCSTNHLTTLLNNAGKTWKAYQEDITGDCVPLTGCNGYAPRHDPFVYFDDVTKTNNPNCAYAMSHIRPHHELAGDLAIGNVAAYNFITPNVCNDGHDSCPPINDGIAQADAWLSVEIPLIMSSQAYQQGGLILLLWDEGNNNADGPIPLIAISQYAKGGGYTNAIPYTHSSTLRTVQEIFGVGPFLGDAANATDLADLFIAPTTTSSGGTTNLITPTGYCITSLARLAGGGAQVTVSGATAGLTNFVQASSNLVDWTCIGTNVPAGSSFTFSENSPTNIPQRFYRVMQAPSIPNGPAKP